MGPLLWFARWLGDEVEIAVRIGLVQRLEQSQVAGGVAGRRCLGERLPIADAQRAVDPRLLGPALVVEWDLDAMPDRRPARSRWEIARGHRVEFVWDFVDTEDRRACGRVRVERDDGRSFGAKSGSLLVANSRVSRQRIPSRTKMRQSRRVAARHPDALLMRNHGQRVARPLRLVLQVGR